MLAKNLDPAEVASEIGEFLRESCGLAPDQVHPELELASAGVDSFSLLEIILFIERRYGVKLPLELLTPENTRSINQLASTAADYARGAVGLPAS